MTTPIETCIERWHAYMKSADVDRLDVLLHPDCVFYSPVVFSPQRGKEITKTYLAAAAVSLGGDPGTGTEEPTGDSPAAFHYVTEILQGHHAMLEFETTMFDPERDRPTIVNGVDIITCDDDALITEFKVMIRPLQAVNLVHAAMRAQLEAMQ